jgi:fructose-1,6-bisphosphatase/inositol monophosphatase family enzyme
MAVDQLLKDSLLSARPDHGWLSEETTDNADRLANRRIFVVDPIDGTVAYMKGKPWWCIPIAIVEDGRPIAAVIHAPALGETFTATLGGGALQGRPSTPLTPPTWTTPPCWPRPADEAALDRAWPACGSKAQHHRLPRPLVAAGL